MNNITTDPNLWAICGLVFVLGLLIGVFLTAGGRRKWRTRYDAEVDRRRELEKVHADREAEWARHEREWHDRESARPVVVKERRGSSTIDTDGDGVPDDVDRRPTDDRKA